MTEELSTSAQETIEAARAFAMRMKHRRTGTGHLLVALSLNPDIARNVLAPQGVTTEALRRQVAEVVGPGDSADALGCPLTADAQTAVEEAGRIAVSMDHEHVWPEHLLLAITSFQSDGRRVLLRSGGNPDEVAELAAESLKTTTRTEDPMDLDIVDTSVGKQHLDHRITRTARVLVPRDHQPGIERVLQSVVVNAPLEKNCSATVSVLSDQFTWTELLSIPVSEWRARVHLPDPQGDVEAHKLADVADDLISRGSRILGV